jgi:hypothetical protein
VAVDRMMQAGPTDVAPSVPYIAYRSRMLGANVRWEPR